jgi:hypothetical protein
MKKAIFGFLHYLLKVFQAQQKVSGKGKVIELCPALKAGFLLES